MNDELPLPGGQSAASGVTAADTKHLKASPNPAVATAESPASSEVVTLLDPDRCIIFAGNGRAACTFDPDRRIDAELLKSISVNGQQVPVTARVRPDGDYEIIAGSRRLGAVRALNAGRHVDEAPLLLRAVLVQMSDVEAYVCATAENDARSPFTKLQVARGWAWELAALHCGEQKKLALARKVDESVVSRTLAMLEVPDEILILLKDREKITPWFAEQMMPALADAQRRETIIEHAAILNEAGSPFTPAALARTLLLSPDEQDTLDDKVFGLGDVARQAVARLESGGTFVLRIKPVAGAVSRPDRKRLIADLVALVSKHVGA